MGLPFLLTELPPVPLSVYRAFGLPINATTQHHLRLRDPPYNEWPTMGTKSVGHITYCNPRTCLPDRGWNGRYNWGMSSGAEPCEDEGPSSRTQYTIWVNSCYWCCVSVGYNSWVQGKRGTIGNGLTYNHSQWFTTWVCASHPYNHEL